MIKIITASLLSLGFTSQVHSEGKCAEQEYIKAEYNIQITSAHKDSKNIQLILWRKGNTVVHQYPATHISESWQKVANRKNLIKPTRYFEQHKRAIEYQPGEVIHGKQESDWSYRAQLVSDKLVNNLELKKQSLTGCQTTQQLSKKTANTEIQLEWLPEVKLVKSFNLKDKKHNETWTLKNVSHDKNLVQAYFNQLDKFQTTDFADIGDDHTDPFLTKMVTLGFIEAGASGFYDDKGKALVGEHNH